MTATPGDPVILWTAATFRAPLLPLDRALTARALGREVHEGAQAVKLPEVAMAAKAASESGRRLPMLDAVRGQMAAAVDSGLGAKDWSAMAAFTLGQDT